VHYFTTAVLPSTKTSINEHNTCPNGEPLVSPPVKIMTQTNVWLLITIKFQHHTTSNYNITTTTIIDLGHPVVKCHVDQRYIILLKFPKACITCQKSMDHTCNIIHIIETMKVIVWSVKRHGDVSIAICAFAYMDHLPDFDDIVAHPELLVPQTILVDEDAIFLPLPISWRPYLGSSMQHHLAWHTTFPFMKSRLVVHCIFGQTLSKYHLTNRTPMTSQTICFAIPKLYLRSVHLNHPSNKTDLACSPWKLISLIVYKTL
jgi:hypothetical protein